MGQLETTSISIGTLAERVRNGELALPEIQRSYVWNRPQVRDFLDSLYRAFPVGTLLLWRTGEMDHSRTSKVKSPLTGTLLLDAPTLC